MSECARMETQPLSVGNGPFREKCHRLVVREKGRHGFTAAYQTNHCQIEKVVGG